MTGATSERTERTERRVRFAPDHGFVLWFCVVGGIGLWMIHISAVVSLARLTCTHPDAEWAAHGATFVLGLLTILGMWGCRNLLHLNRDANELDRDHPARMRFLATFGLWTGGFSLLLIVWEGMYVPFLSGCRV